MAFTGGAEQVGAPDKQVTREVLWIIRLFRRKADSAVLQGFCGVSLRILTGFFCSRRDSQRVHVQLRCGRQPAHALGTDVEVQQAAAEAGFVRQRGEKLLRLNSFITPLA